MLMLGPAAAAQQETTPADPSQAASEQPETAPEDAPEAPAVPSAASRAFAGQLAQLLITERKVNAYEQDILGSEPMGRLKGDRRRRRLRSDDDVERLARWLEELPLKGHVVPDPSQALRDLTGREALVLSRLARAYEASRADVQPIKRLVADDAEFLSTANWVLRDKLVKTRDEIFGEELAWTDLIDKGHEIVATGLPRAVLEQMLATLDQLSPETQAEQDSLLDRLLTDIPFRSQVSTELTALLSQPRTGFAPAESDAELLSRIPVLQQTLIEASGLKSTASTLSVVEGELGDIDTALADRGVNMLPPGERQRLLGRKAELSVERNRLQAKWQSTPPEAKAAAQLQGTLDDLIRRRMFDLGPQAALFGYRYDELIDEQASLGGSPGEIWAHLESQLALVSSLDAARPAPNPLDGLSKTPQIIDIGTIDAAMLLKAGNLPKPKPGNAPKPKPKGKGRP